MCFGRMTQRKKRLHPLLGVITIEGTDIHLRIFAQRRGVDGAREALIGATSGFRDVRCTPRAQLSKLLEMLRAESPAKLYGSGDSAAERLEGVYIEGIRLFQPVCAN